MTFAEATIGQTIIRDNPEKLPSFGRVVGKDQVGPMGGRPRILLQTVTGTVAVPVVELKEWKALHA